MNWAETGESFNRIATGPTLWANGSSKTSHMCSLPCHRIAHYRTEQGDTFLFSGAFVIFYNSRAIFTTPSSFRSIGSGHQLFNPPKEVGMHRVAEVSVRGWVCKAELHRLRARLQSSGREKRLDMLWCCVAGTPITALEDPGRLGTAAHYQRRGASAATPFLRVAAEVRCSRTGHQSVHLCAGTVSMAPVTSVGGGMGLAERLRMGRLEEDGLSYKESFIVRCYEVGINKTATVETIANLLQEVGCNHAQSVGFSTDGFATTNTMRELRLIWVTSRMHIEIYKYPAWGDVVEIETWCQGEGRIGTRRDWIIKDLSIGSIIGRATSKWVMMNQDTRKLQRVSDEVREEYLIYCPRTLRLAFPEEDSDSLKKIFKLEDPADYSRLGLVPRRADLDMNQHVNNVTYIGWVLESMPQAIIDTHELQTITVDYRRECRHDDMVDSLTSSESEEMVLAESTNGSPSIKQHGSDHLQFLHFLRLSGTGLEINRGRTIWRKLMR